MKKCILLGQKWREYTDTPESLYGRIHKLERRLRRACPCEIDSEAMIATLSARTSREEIANPCEERRNIEVTSERFSGEIADVTAHSRDKNPLQIFSESISIDHPDPDRDDIFHDPHDLDHTCIRSVFELEEWCLEYFLKEIKMFSHSSECRACRKSEEHFTREIGS